MTNSASVALTFESPKKGTAYLEEDR